MSYQVRAVIEETLARYYSPQARVRQVEPVPMADHERGWSGAEIRRYKVSLQQGEPVSLLTKTMPRKERRVMDLLSQDGHRNVPFAYTHDLTTEGPVLTCLQDLGSTRVGIPTTEDGTPTTPELDRQVARALAAIHVGYLGQQQQLAWLPCADVAYVTDFLVREVWRGNWEEALATNAAFAAEFAQYTPALEEAASQFARTIQDLWQEGDCLTLTHGEVHGEHIMLYAGRPYLSDWGWAYYGPFYLDLPAYFTPQTVHHYHRALTEQGIELPLADFMERFHAIGRYVGFKYLCSGIWLWPPGPTTATGQRILLTIKWALEGTWPARAFAVSLAAWHQLLADHNRRLSMRHEVGC
jgi:hypothetical protein